MNETIKELESIISELDEKIGSLEKDDNDLASGIRIGINAANATIRTHLEELRKNTSEE